MLFHLLIHEGVYFTKLGNPRDISQPEIQSPLKSVGSISAHTRPVECLDGQALSDHSAILYTGDTMGVIKVWDLQKDDGFPSRWAATLKDTINHHRTRINELIYQNGHLWTASSDETVRVLINKSSNPDEKISKAPRPIAHPVTVRAILPLPLTDLGEPYLLTAAGDVLRTYDISELDEPELLSQVDGHWHDITAIRLWKRKASGEDGRTRIEPWIVTTGLDKTIRKWKLAELLNPSKPVEPEPKTENPEPTAHLTEEEERELAELMEG